jgi:hypothetical protein
MHAPRKLARAAAAAVVVGLVSGAAGVAYASWSAGGSGSAAATARTLGQGPTPTTDAATGGATVVVSWAAASLSNGGPAATGYTVKRYDTNNNLQSIGAGCNTVIAGLTCTETATPVGIWRYTVTPQYQSWVGTESSQSATRTVDTTAPALSSLEMFDSNSNGKIDRVVATFNETLAGYTAGTAPWTLTGQPSGVSLASVSVAGAQATLTLNEGSAFDTQASGFKIALAASAAGIRDAAGNQSSFAATAVADKALPVPVSLTLTNNNGNAGSGDTASIIFSEPLRVSTVCNTWSGDASDQVVTGNGTVTVTIANNGTNDALSITAGCTPNFGTVNLGGDYVAATTTFSGNGSNRSMISWTVATRTLTITLGSPSGAVNTVGTAGTPTYVPSTAITDLAGNAMAGTAYTASAPSRL